MNKFKIGKVSFSLENHDQGEVEINTAMAMDGDDKVIDQEKNKIFIEFTANTPLSDVFAKAMMVNYNKENATTNVSKESMLNDAVIAASVLYTENNTPVATNRVNVGVYDASEASMSDLMEIVKEMPYDKNKKAVIAFNGISQESLKKITPICEFRKLSVVTSIDGFIKYLDNVRKGN